MISDYFKKVLQGSLFRQHINAIMGVSHQDYIRYAEAYKTAKEAAQSKLS